MHVVRAREFFGPRAHDWDARFPDDAPAYERAARELAPRPGGVVVDLGCGTGRALPALRAVAGPAATIIGVDVTAEMLAAARAHGRDGAARSSSVTCWRCRCARVAWTRSSRPASSRTSPTPRRS